jgi:type I restriction enzyme S subunit
MSKSEKGRLDKYCEIVMGQSPSGESYNYEAKGLKLIAGAGDFGEVYPSAKKYTTEASKISKYGDIVLGIRASIGDKVLSDGEYCLGRGVAGLRPLSKLDARYLWHWLDHIRPILSAKSKGATFKQVNREDICELEINIIQLEEQKRIAEILDRTQSLISKGKEAIAKLDTLTQSIFLEMFGDPVKNENNLPVVRLGDLTKISSGSTPSRKIPEYFNGNIPWVKTTEVNGSLITDTEEKITDSALKNSSCHLYPVGSILIALYGQGKTRGQCAVLGIEAATNQACGALLPNASYNTNFLFAQLSMSYNRLRAMARGGNQENLNLGLISEFTVLLPSLPLQKEFAQRVEAVEKLKATHRASLSQLEALFASLQHRAFRGEL